MNFDQFLKVHQILAYEASRGGTSRPELNEFIEKIEVAISAYSQIHDTLKYQLRQWDEKCRRLCELRDGIMRIERDLEDDNKK